MNSQDGNMHLFHLREKAVCRFESANFSVYLKAGKSLDDGFIVLFIKGQGLSDLRFDEDRIWRKCLMEMGVKLLY